jgi:hypothetical protein
VSAVSEIEAREIGNESEVRTVINVGAQMEILQRIEELQKNMAAAQDNITRIEKGLIDFDTLIEQGTLQRDDPRRMQLMKVKIRDTAQLASDKAEMQYLNDIIARSRDASIAVLDKVFPRTEVGINRCKVIVKEYQQSVRFVQQEDKIVMQSMLAK